MFLWYIVRMSEEEESKRAFKIKDNRRFDSAGNERSEDKEESRGAVQAKAQPSVLSQSAQSSSVQSDMSRGNAAAGASRPASAGFSSAKAAEHLKSEKTYAESAGSFDAPLDFSSFVISLATQALMQIGAVEPPPGVQVPIDSGAARQTIDILTMLQQRTKGNLDSAESQMLEEILHNLRMSFIKVSGR